MSLTINGQKICGKGRYVSLRTSGNNFRLEMMLPAKEIKRINDFLLIYQGKGQFVSISWHSVWHQCPLADGIEGIYDVCKQSRLEPGGSGFITSPNYPYPYQWNHNCTMTIANTPGNMILLETLGKTCVRITVTRIVRGITANSELHLCCEIVEL